MYYSHTSKIICKHNIVLFAHLTHARTHARTDTHTLTHTHTHTRARAHTTQYTHARAHTHTHTHRRNVTGGGGWGRGAKGQAKEDGIRNRWCLWRWVSKAYMCIQLKPYSRVGYSDYSWTQWWVCFHGDEGVARMGARLSKRQQGRPPSQCRRHRVISVNQIAVGVVSNSSTNRKTLLEHGGLHNYAAFPPQALKGDEGEQVSLALSMYKKGLKTNKINAQQLHSLCKYWYKNRCLQVEIFWHFHTVSGQRTFLLRVTFKLGLILDSVALVNAWLFNYITQQLIPNCRDQSKSVSCQNKWTHATPPRPTTPTPTQPTPTSQSYPVSLAALWKRKLVGEGGGGRRRGTTGVGGGALYSHIDLITQVTLGEPDHWA